MKSEALRNIRTLRQVKISLDVARGQKLRMTNSLSKTKEEVEALETLTDAHVKQVVDKEKKRVAAYEASVTRSRQRMFRARQKLALTINRNRALTALRQEMQRARWDGDDCPGPKAETPAPGPKQRQIELNY